MVKYKHITNKNSPNYTPQAQVPAVFGYSRGIDYITIHWWGDPNNKPSFSGVVSWLCNPSAGVSAHEVVTGTGNEVATLVAYQNAAWHAGSSRGNARSVGIECDPRCREVDYQVVAQVVADIWKAYGRIIKLKGHNEWISTRCPGNYNLTKIYNMAHDIYTGKNTPTPKPKTATRSEVEKAYLDILERKADAGGIKTYTTNGMTIAQVRADLLKSSEYKKLQDKKKAEAAKKEWIKNLTPYHKDDSKYAKTTKLSVLPASGVQVINLETGKQIQNSLIPRGTQVDITAKTKVKGVEYLISRYSKDKGMASGIVSSGLGKVVEPPKEEKPEWLKNLVDIADKDMWTRSETPVLDIENGNTVKTLPINTKVRVTHATQIVGKDLLVLDGGETVVDTVYLSDTEIKNPDTDLEERVTAIEKFLEVLKDLLNNLFNKK